MAFDENGALGKQGVVNMALVQKCMIWDVAFMKRR